MENVRDTFGILLNCIDVATMSRGTVNKHWHSARYADISGIEMAEEILNIPPLSSKNTALDLPKCLHQKQLQEIFPNLWIFLRIAVTLAVTVAAAERSFSKLKLLKNDLRSSMTQETLSELALININRELAQQISFEVVVDEFA